MSQLVILMPIFGTRAESLSVNLVKDAGDPVDFVGEAQALS